MEEGMESPAAAALRHPGFLPSSSPEILGDEDGYRETTAGDVAVAALEAADLGGLWDGCKSDLLSKPW